MIGPPARYVPRGVASLGATLLSAAAMAGAGEPPVHLEVGGSDGAWQMEIRHPRYNRPNDVRIAPHLGWGFAARLPPGKVAIGGVE